MDIVGFMCGIAAGYMALRWDDSYPHKELSMYAFYYFHSVRHQQYASIADSDVMFDIYRDIFKGEERYHHYVAAISAHYDEALVKSKYYFTLIFKKELLLYSISLAAGLVVSIVLTLQWSSLLFTTLGFMLYVIARYSYFIFRNNFAAATCNHMVVQEAIDLYRAKKQ